MFQTGHVLHPKDLEINLQPPPSPNLRLQPGFSREIDFTPHFCKWWLACQSPRLPAARGGKTKTTTGGRWTGWERVEGYVVLKEGHGREEGGGGGGVCFEKAWGMKGKTARWGDQQKAELFEEPERKEREREREPELNLFLHKHAEVRRCGPGSRAYSSAGEVVCHPSPCQPQRGHIFPVCKPSIHTGGDRQPQAHTLNLTRKHTCTNMYSTHANTVHRSDPRARGPDHACASSPAAICTNFSFFQLRILWFHKKNNRIVLPCTVLKIHFDAFSSFHVELSSWEKSD